MRNTVLNGDCLALLRTLPDNSADALVTDPPAGVSFMSRAWDSDKGGRRAWIAWLAEVLSECRRVVKPGGHALVWSLPRTSHWTGTALEDAEWEIRDSIAHVFGTGFPKSLDISKALAATGADAAAQQWDGWGTALKPGHEVWWLARKPLAQSSIAQQVLATATGAINISAVRVPHTAQAEGRWGAKNKQRTRTVYGAFADEDGETSCSTRNSAGRWPSNLVLTHSFDCTPARCALSCPVAQLDAQSGISRRTGGFKPGFDDVGGASRFFPTFYPMPAEYADDPIMRIFAAPFYYSAKASRRERDAGCEQLPLHTAAETVDRTPGSAGMQSPRAGAGRTSGAYNHHPTTKPLALMRWLCKLITPPGGLVLDPFGGSGTTGVAALLEGFDYLLCEQDDEYLPIITARLAWAQAQYAAQQPSRSRTRARQHTAPAPVVTTLPVSVATPTPTTTRSASSARRRAAARQAQLSLWEERAYA